MERAAAKRIVPMLMKAASEAAATIEVFRTYHSADRTKAYSDAIGKVMFALDDVLRPVIAEFPDLHP